MVARRTIVELRCPACRRWLSDAVGYGRAVCPPCGWEVVVSDKAHRHLTDRYSAPTIDKNADNG